MKLLVVCQHYYPEPFRITDICEELVRQGHEVFVITGTPNYPMGKIYEGYKGKEKRDEIRNGVKIHRCFEIGRRSGVLFRFLNYYSFAWSSKRYVRKCAKDFDVIFANQLSPIMMVDAAVKYKKKYGTKLLMYCMDLWPESLTAGGVKKGSFLYRHYHKVSKKIYTKADKLLITSTTFKDYLVREFGISEEKIQYMPQYAEDLFNAQSLIKEPNGQVDLFFAGNIGAAQSVETIIEAAAKTQDIDNLRWHIVGDGSSLENCKKLAEELKVKTVYFYGRKPVEEMPQFYKQADAMLVTLTADSFIGTTLPGKVQTYMAAGKPIIGAIEGETERVIAEANCGYCGKALDSEVLALNARKFCEDVRSGKAKTYGENAANYYKDYFGKEKFFEIVNANLEK